MVGPNGIGPFHSDEWRVGLTIQLVEGGSNGPYWLTTPGELIPGVARPDFLLIDSLEPQKIADSLVVMLVATTTPQEHQKELLDVGVLTKTERGIGFPSPWIFPKRVMKDRLLALSDSYRIGIVSLDEFSLISDQVISILRNWNIEVKTFMPSETLIWPAT